MSFFGSLRRVKKISGEAIEMNRKAKTIQDFSHFGISEGTVVTVTECDSMRGYAFKDDNGHFVAETGWNSVEFIDD